MTMVTTGPEMPGPELNGEHPGPCSFLRRFPSSYHPRSPQIYLPDDHVSNESVRHAILPLVSSFPTINSAGNTYTCAETFRTNLDGYRAFLQARLARIAPMNAVALLLVTPLTLAILPRLGIHLSTATLVLSWLANLTLTEAWVPNAAM